MAVEDEESGSQIDAELAFIQKKIQDGVNRKLKEVDARHRGEVDALNKEHQAELDRLDRKHRDDQAKLEHDLKEKAADELKVKTENLTEKFADDFAAHETKLKAQIAAEKKAFEEDLHRRSDADLARDKRDLEETFRARTQKREEELRERMDEDLKVRTAELRRSLDVEFQQKLTQERQRLEDEAQNREQERLELMDADVSKKLELEKARLESDNSRRLDLEETRLQREAKDHLTQLEQDLREKTTTTLENERRKIEEAFRVRLLRRGRYSHLSHNLHQDLFPFPAMVGMEKAKRAMILNAINPSIGGVVLWGAEGNGKFSMLLSFAELLGPEDKRLVGREDEYKPWNDEERYLVGRIHYGREMAGYLIDTYLQTAALSLPRTRRHHDSVTQELPPLLLSSLKEEDEQAYHLISEYTLHVEVQSPTSVEERLEVMHRNADFRKDPVGFRKNYQGAGGEILGNVISARDRLTGISISTKVLALIARMTILDKQSARLDVLMEHLARTNAAFDGRQDVDSTDVMEAADLALMHRLTPRELSEFERAGGPGEGSSQRSK